MTSELNNTLKNESYLSLLHYNHNAFILQQNLVWTYYFFLIKMATTHVSIRATANSITAIESTITFL